MKHYPEDINQWFAAIRSGDVSSLSKAITLVENEKPEALELANELLQLCRPYLNSSFRIGVTGIPGVGKSTFINALGKNLIQKRHKLAVLTIDPSSSINKGSILGDKTRMMDLSSMENVYIRPSPSGGTLGGAANKTREAIWLCETANYDTVLIETVGVGQSEIDIDKMVDITIVLMMPATGDDLQGIKRGIMEIGDLFVINKADGNLEKEANHAKATILNALNLFQNNHDYSGSKVLICSSLQEKGIEEVVQSIINFKTYLQENELLNERRKTQLLQWFYDNVDSLLRHKLLQGSKYKSLIQELEQKVQNQHISPTEAAHFLIEKILL
jgi:LAO/AO transport system kinase